MTISHSISAGVSLERHAAVGCHETSPVLDKSVAVAFQSKSKEPIRQGSHRSFIAMLIV